MGSAPLETIRVQPVKAVDQENPGEEGTECVPVGYDNVQTPAQFILKLGMQGCTGEGNGREGGIPKSDSGQIQQIHSFCQFLTVYPGRTEDFKGHIGTATRGNVGAFQQTDAGIHRGRLQVRHVGGGFNEC